MSKGFFKYPINYDAFLAEDDISYYLLGAYMTDGCITIASKNSYKISITSKDKNWLIKIRNIISENKPVYKKKENSYAFEFTDETIANWLILYGCTPQKSATIRLEKEIPQNFQKDFIRGLVDGDGSISTYTYKATKISKAGKEYFYKSSSVYICGISKEFLEDVKKIIPSDIKCYINSVGKNNGVIDGREINCNYDVYRLSFSHKNSQKLLEWIYYPNNKISLPRKEELSKLICGVFQI